MPNPTAQNRLRVLRAERRVNQYDVALATQVSPNRYWRIENGYTEPTDAERKAFAAFFGASLAEVFPSEVAS